ncbi:pyruvate formate-lyase 3-activating enzyme [Salmonella enterica subsp. enterica]|nr:pyruvate formate-lyase 3-activating enzyme [Salmonella enterica subsp. enterica]
MGCRWCQNPESRARAQDLLYDARLCLEGCDLCAQAAPDVIERALNGLLIHREKLTDAIFSVPGALLPHTGVNRVRRNKKRG